MTDTNASAFRRFMWPIFGREHFKFLPMTFMISAILFNYTILRNMKDSLVMEATGSSAIIPALKGFAVLPMAILFFLVITKLYSAYSREKVFYIIIGFFVAFFSLFALVLYPLQEVIHPYGAAASLLEILPSTTFFVNVVDIFKYWSFSLFYIFSELWGSVVASLLFWQYANSIIKVSEAKRFYGHFYLLANLATATAGYMSGVFSKLGQPEFQVTVNYAVTSMVCVSALILFVYYWMDKNISKNPEFVSPDEIKPKKKKPKLSVGSSLKFIFSSPYLGLIALLVLCYGISINLIEVVWKGQITSYFQATNPANEVAGAINSFMGTVSMFNGLATFIVILVGGYFVRLLGWRFGALTTPVIIGITGAGFFYYMIFVAAGATPGTEAFAHILWMTVLFGTIQNILSKSTKYALFDPTKEMSYIPLDDESKSKGKAAVDVVGGRLGKAGGGYILNFLFLFTATGVTGIVPTLAIIVLGILGIWIFAVLALYKRFIAAGGESGNNQKSEAKA